MIYKDKNTSFIDLKTAKKNNMDIEDLLYWEL